MEALHARVEVDQPDGDAGDADDRQPGLVALALDEPAFLDVDVERVGEDVDGVEADLLGHADAEGGVAAGLGPGGVDQAEFHDATSHCGLRMRIEENCGWATKNCPAAVCGFAPPRPCVWRFAWRFSATGSVMAPNPAFHVSARYRIMGRGVWNRGACFGRLPPLLGLPGSISGHPGDRRRLSDARGTAHRHRRGPGGQRHRHLVDHAARLHRRRGDWR